MNTTHRLFNRNANDLSPIPDKSVHLIVTSPPYPMIEMWDQSFIEQDPSISEDFLHGHCQTAFEKMHRILDAVWRECDRVLVDHGFICINIGDATRSTGGEFHLFPNHARVINFFTQLGGYCVLPDIHWRKRSNAPNKFMGSGMYPAGAYVTYEHEYILIFRKGGKRVFDNEKKQRRRESAYFWEERNTWFSDLWDVRGIPQQIHGMANRHRSAAYPFEIPYRLINMYSIKNDTILDPFCGLGTTLLACMATQRSSIGIELDESIYTLAQKSLMVPCAELNQIIDQRIAYHNAFIDSLSADKQGRCYRNRHHHFLVKTRQETDLSLKHITSITATAGGMECTYQSSVDVEQPAHQTHY